MVDRLLISKIFSGQVDPNIQEQHGGTVLHNLARNRGPLDLVKRLIDLGANPNIREPDRGDTPLIYATLWTNPEMIRALFEGAADINRPNDDGRTPLHIAHDIKIIQTLLELDADPNVKNDYGSTPLHVQACFRYGSSLNNVKALLERGADPNIKNNGGKTPLLIAVEDYRIAPFVKLFIEWGAIPTLVDNDGNAPIHHHVVQEEWNKFIGARLGLMDSLSKRLPPEIIDLILSHVYGDREREREQREQARWDRTRERERERKRVRHI
jgi:ankyrin repeat protein